MFNIENITINEVKKIISTLPIRKEVKISFENCLSLIIELRSYISNKYSISEKEAEDKIRHDVKNKNIDASNLSQYLNDYALDEGFPKSNELKDSVVNLIKIIR